MSRHVLETRRLLCPMPVIRTQDKVRQLDPGDILEVIATDPGALNDIPAWSRINGHKVLASRREGGEVVVVIEVGQKGGGTPAGQSAERVDRKTD